MNKDFTEVENININLASFGGRDMTVGDLFAEVRRSRRNRLTEIICGLEVNASTNLLVFDGITFNALIENHIRQFNEFGNNYEGDIEYEISLAVTEPRYETKWHCKTTITWESDWPCCFGHFNYHTEVEANENAAECMHRLHASSGAGMSIKILAKNLTNVSHIEALNRDLRVHAPDQVRPE